MTPMFTALQKSGRAALLALTLGTVAMTAMPVAAQAQEFNFRLGVGNDGNALSFNFGNSDQRRNFRPSNRCMSDRQVERGLRHYGFRDAEIVRYLGRNRVGVLAEYRNRDYSLKVNKCSGEVYDVQRLRRDRGQPGFRFNFNF